VGALYTVTTAEWQAINQRTSDVLQLQQLAQTVEQYIPTYPALLAASTQWQSQTLPGLVQQSVQVGVVSADIAAALQTLQQSTAGLSPADPLPPTAQFIYSVKFGAIADQAGLAQTALQALSPGIDAFVTQNLQANADLVQLEQNVGTIVADVVGPLGTLNTGLDALANGWSALITQLQALSAPTARVTTDMLLQADIGAGLAQWTALNDSAVAFDSQVSTQT
jgi:hypothetical protein